MSMLKELTQVHLKAVRWPLVPIVLLSLGLPMYALRIIQVIPPQIAAAGNGFPRDVLRMQESWVAMFPVFACIVGATIALTAWSWDHQARHIYALSLPVSRTRYALLKMLAGLLVMVIPVGAIAIGTFLGLALTDLPEGLHGYPLAFILRFTLAALIVYAMVFSLASTTIKTTSLVLGGIIVVFVFGTVITGIIAQATHDYDVVTPMTLLGRALINWPGPFAVFGGSWMIIDA